MKNRIKLEKQYWNKNALDPQVDKKYICDISDDEFIKIVGNLKGKVLDLGCGVGRLTFDGYHGTDTSENMLEIARDRRKLSKFVICDGKSIPFNKSFFNNVFSVLLFQHIPLKTIRKYIKEISRVLKKNGTFTFQFIDGNEDELFSKHHDLEEIKKSLKENGFTIKKIDKGLIHKQWTWITAKL